MMIPMYQQFLLTGVPDLTIYGIQPYKFMGHHALFPRDKNGNPITSGPVDEERIRWHLRDLEPGTPVFLNLECAEWRTLEITNPNHGKFRFRQRGVDLRLELLELCRQIDPSLLYGFYREPDYWGSLVLNRPNEWYDYVQRLSPLLEMQDFSIPQFYFNRTNSMLPAGLADALLCCERHFGVLCFVAPLTEIWPVVWPVWYDVWREHPNPHTPEHRDRCEMPGHVWRALLQYVIPHSDGLFIWGQGGAPWNPSAKWWRILRKYTSKRKRC